MHPRILLLTVLAAVALPALAVDKIPIANEGAISDKWGPVPGTMFTPAYPEAYASNQEQVCVTIGYLLNADGHTSDFSLVKSWNSGDNPRSRKKFWETFAGDSSRALAMWKFAPKPGVASPKPVFTAATFVFGPGNHEETKAHCAISDLTKRLVELRYDSRAGRLMAGGIFSQLDIDPFLEEHYRHGAAMNHESAVAADMARSEQESKGSQLTEHPVEAQ